MSSLHYFLIVFQKAIKKKPRGRSKTIEYHTTTNSSIASWSVLLVNCSQKIWGYKLWRIGNWFRLSWRQTIWEKCQKDLFQSKEDFSHHPVNKSETGMTNVVTLKRPQFSENVTNKSQTSILRMNLKLYFESSNPNLTIIYVNGTKSNFGHSLNREFLCLSALFWCVKI